MRKRTTSYMLPGRECIHKDDECQYKAQQSRNDLAKDSSCTTLYDSERPSYLGMDFQVETTLLPAGDDALTLFGSVDDDVTSAPSMPVVIGNDYCWASEVFDIGGTGEPGNGT